MHIFNKNRVIFFICTTIALSTSIFGMKRTLEQTDVQAPLTANNLLQLPLEIFPHIFGRLSTMADLNMLCKVCKFFASCAGKQNKNILLPYIANALSLQEKRQFLTEYFEKFNIKAVKGFLSTIPADSLLWEKKGLLMHYVNASMNDPQYIQHCAVIMQNCPEGEFMNKTPYNGVLHSKIKYLRNAVASPLYPYISQPSLETIYPQYFPKDREAIIESAEKVWEPVIKQNKEARQHAYNLLHDSLNHAVEQNRIDVVEALLQATPYKNHFKPLCLPPLPFQHLFRHALYSNPPIFAALVAWVKNYQDYVEGVDIDEKISPIICECIFMGLPKHLESFIKYFHDLGWGTFRYEFERTQPWIAEAIAQQQWPCLSVLCASLNTEKGLGGWSVYPELKSLRWHNVVLHEAGILPGPAPIEYTTPDPLHKQLASNIRILKKQNPAIFKELVRISDFLHKQEMHWTAQCPMPEHIDRRIKNDSSLIDPILASMRSYLAELETKSSTIKPNLLKKIADIILSLERYKQGYEEGYKKGYEACASTHTKIK